MLNTRTDMQTPKKLVEAGRSHTARMAFVLGALPALGLRGIGRSLQAVQNSGDIASDVFAENEVSKRWMLES
jgi:hypothetical protein